MQSKSLVVASLLMLAVFAVAGLGFRRGYAAATQAKTLGPLAPAVAGQSANHGFNLANLDTSVSACANFFQYANGGWMYSHEIPAAYARWGNFNELAERNRDKLHEILEAAAKNKNAPKGSNEQKIGDYYASCM